LPYVLTAGDLADAGMAGSVVNNDKIAREERRVRARQIEQHVVVAGHRDNTHLGDFWRRRQIIVGPDRHENPAVRQFSRKHSILRPQSPSLRRILWPRAYC
jgi:hypothetical protein